jgi:serine/threonine-protein kinase HipA
MDKLVYVYVDLDGKLYLVGRLWARSRKNRESATFEYADSWLQHPNRFALEPMLSLDPGPFHTPADKAIFGALGDSAPDRWGRILMRRFERRRAESSKEAIRTLQEIDYLLMVNDKTRQGALRFTTTENGPFLAIGGIPIPPLLDLPKLLSASERIASETDTDEDLKLLLAPGSSLGGARPKASVYDKDGSFLIAKFPRSEDEINVVLWEALALALAKKAGINVTKWRVENIAGKDVLLVKRFDRYAKGKRLPFLSAMSMLGAKDNESHSYLEIADAIRQFGAKPIEDLHELWRRIVFNILIANTDDHFYQRRWMATFTSL